MKYFTNTHEWVTREYDNEKILVMGISDYGQSVIGDVVYVDIFHNESEYKAGDAIAVLESSKAALDIYTPISGMVVLTNDIVASNCECINKDPFGDGWLVKFQVSDVLKLEEELQVLMSEDAYAKYCEHL